MLSCRLYGRQSAYPCLPTATFGTCRMCTTALHTQACRASCLQSLCWKTLRSSGLRDCNLVVRRSTASCMHTGVLMTSSGSSVLTCLDLNHFARRPCVCLTVSSACMCSMKSVASSLWLWPLYALCFDAAAASMVITLQHSCLLTSVWILFVSFFPLLFE